jgi:predicted nucleic acid-binding Zn ribbon protein
LIKVICATCKKTFFRPIGRVNEAKKFGWKQYCSKICQNKSKLKGIKEKCANPNCQKIVYRQLHEYKKSKSGRIFCSSSCAAIFNNLARRKIKKCPICGKEFYAQRKYCSNRCRSEAVKFKSKIIRVSKIQIINEIKKFYEKTGRIPLKREFHHYNAARNRFGSWNKAIEAAGFNPNPVIFTKKFIAKDGHICDSFAEKIIDDWLFERKIKHERNVSYPGNKKLTADFVIKNNWIEFFGLSGEIKDYDKFIKKKRALSKKYKLRLIEIYPKDLFPVNHLSGIIKI